MKSFWELLSTAQPFALIAAIGFFLLNSFGGLLAWHTVLNSKAKLSLKEIYPIFSLSLLAKYLPFIGKFLQLVPIIKSKSPLDFSVAFLVSNFIGLSVGIFIVLLGSSYWLREFSQYQTGAIAVGAILYLALIGLFFFSKIVTQRLEAITESIKALSARTLALVFCIHLFLSWLPEAAALQTLAAGLGYSFSLSDSAFLFTSYAIASMAGYLAVFVPGGLGVRDGLFVILLQARLPLPTAILIALGMRAAALAADLIFSLGLVNVKKVYSGG